MGNANILSLSFVIGVTSWTSIAKVVRTEVRQIRNSEYIIAARCMGAGFFRILWKHLVPNFFSSIMFMVVMNVRTAMISEATLSFMGIGLPIEVITWGSMLSLSDKAFNDRFLVDHSDPRTFPDHHSTLPDQYRKRLQRADKQKRK